MDPFTSVTAVGPEIAINLSVDKNNISLISLSLLFPESFITFSIVVVGYVQMRWMINFKLIL